jgi:hypothetical protein
MTSQLQAEPHVSDPSPHRNRAMDAARRRGPAVIALLVLVGIGVGAALATRPPSARSASAPAASFSAERAIAQLTGIASVPHPTGSSAAADVRAHLVAELRELGLEPDVQTRVAARSLPGGSSVAGTVANVYARLAGSNPSGRVLLVAHYDSVPTGPGASDNGANVATVLEVARALRAGPAPRNDVDFLFTDGEESGLLGAQAFVDSGAAGDPAKVVVVNLEARGVSGPAVMFQMAGTGLAPAVRAADAFTTSFAAAVYQVLPNDTDLTAFHDGGMRGLNFAFLEGSAYYHAPDDDIAHVNSGSVQDMGDAALAAVQYLAAADLVASGGDATYFTVFGGVVSYPSWLVLPLAALALAGFVALLWTGRRRGLRLRGVGRAAATFGIMVPGVVVIGLGIWLLLIQFRPDFTVGLGGVYRPGPYLLGEAALLLAVLVFWYRWARRRASAEEITAGVLGWLTLLALVLAVLLPGAAYLFTWPALIGVAAQAAAQRFAPDGSLLRSLAGYAAAVPAMVLVLPIALVLVPALGLGLSAAPLLLAALIAATLAGALEPLPPRRWLTLATACLVAAAAVSVAVTAAADGYDRFRPRPVSLGYVLESDGGAATWVSAGGPDQPVVGQLVTAGQVLLNDRVPPIGMAPVSYGPAPVTALEGPVIEAVPASGTSTGDVRTVHVRIRVPTSAYAVGVYADTTAYEIVDATVNGVPIAGSGTAPSEATKGFRWGFRYAGPSAEGVDLIMHIRGTGQLPLRAVSSTAGLPPGVGAPSLPPDVTWSSWPVIPAQTFVVRTAQF